MMKTSKKNPSLQPASKQHLQSMPVRISLFLLFVGKMASFNAI